MSEQLKCILDRIDSKHLSKLWLFYRDYFPDDTSCLQFFYNALRNEPERNAVINHLSNNEQEQYQSVNRSTICDTDFIPRRMINEVERLISAARDMEQIRRGKDIFKIVFLVTCVETLQNLIGNNVIKKKQLFDFFEKYTTKTDKDYIASNFILEDENIVSHECSGFKCFIGIINEYRNCAVHEADYWDLCFNNREDGFPLLINLKINLENFSKNNKKDHCFHTTISYKAFEKIFVRTCIHFIQDYMSNHYSM